MATENDRGDRPVLVTSDPVWMEPLQRLMTLRLISLAWTVHPRAATLTLLGSLLLAGCAPVGEVPPAPLFPSRLLDEDLAERAQVLTESITAEPRNVAARAKLGMLYEANGLHGVASVCYENALSLDPKDAKLWFRLAIALSHEGDLQGAIDAMDEVTRLDRSYIPAQARRATWLLDAGDIEAAQRVLERMSASARAGDEAVFAAARVYLARHEPLAAQQLITTSRVLVGRNSGHARQLLARAYRLAGRLEEAEATVQNTPLVRPVFPDPWTRELASFRMPARRLTQARRLMQEGRFDEALVMLEDMARILTDDQRIFNLLAQCYLRENRFDEAHQALEEALALAPDHFATRLNLAKTLLVSASSGPSTGEKALQHIDKATRLRPASGEAHIVRGAILLSLSRSEEAIAAYALGWRLDARDSKQVLRAASFLVNRGDYDRARQLFEMLLEAEPTNPPAMFGLARCTMESGEWARAEELLSDLAGMNAIPRRLAAANARLRALRDQAP